MKFKTIGSDPEFFILDPKGNPYPATKFSSGTKEEPFLIVEGFYEQRDNVSFEGNVPPATNKEDFIYNITFLRDYFVSKVEKYGYSISPNGVEYFSKRILELPEANEFGCSRVISSWDSNDMFFNDRPTPILSDVKYRVSGFHIHIGYDLEGLFKNLRYPKETMNILIGRLFDLFVTMPSQDIKEEPERLKSYGAYGIIRFTDYGVECRTLSTYFTQKEYLSWVWDQIMKIEQFINDIQEDYLKQLIRDNYFVNYNYPPSSIFEKIFRKFSEKKVLESFEETKNLI